MVGNASPIQKKPLGSSYGFFGPLLKQVRYWCAPTDAPFHTIDRVEKLAKRGLEQADIRGVTSRSAENRFNEAISEELKKRQLAIVAARKTVKKGAVAEIPNCARDEEITLPPTLQARVEAIDWNHKMHENRDILTRKISSFTALILMRDAAGVKSTDKLVLMNLVKKATNEASPKTLWALFTEEFNDLSLFQKFKAGWYYWAYYQTSLINNTVHAYLKSFVNNLTSDLKKENSTTRSTVFRKFLENTNDFLIDDLKAMEDFAYKRGHGELERYRNAAIDRHLGISLKELCEVFSQRRVEGDSPEVKFFETMQKVPLVGLFFLLFQKFVNKFIIQRLMKSSIMPAALESAVLKGLETTEPEKLPFAISITEFLTSQFTKLKDKMDEDSALGEKPKPFPGTEKLPVVIARLRKAIALQPYEKEEKLREQIEKLEANNEGSLENAVDQTIQDGIINAGNILFHYLNETAQSGELFANLLELSAAPFSGENESLESLMEKYETEQLKLKNISEEVFVSIIDSAVKNGFSSNNSESIRRSAEESFESRKIIAAKTGEEITALCEQMERKINTFGVKGVDNTIQAEISNFFQVMKVFASQKEVLNELDALDGASKNLVWRLITPIYEKAEKLEEKMIHLQELQDKYPSLAKAEEQLSSIQTILTSIQRDFLPRPRHHLNAILESLKACENEMKKCLEEEWGGAVSLRKYIDQITKSCEQIESHQKVIDAVKTLYPPIFQNDENPPEGLLDQLFKYKKGNHSTGLSPRVCLEKIEENIEFLPKEQRDTLKHLIGNGSQLIQNWEQIGNILQGVYQDHLAYKRRDGVPLQTLLPEVSAWVEDKASKYRQLKEHKHAQMKREIKAIKKEVPALKTLIDKAELNFPPAFSPIWNKVANATLGAAGGAAMGLFGWLHPMGFAAATALSTGTYTFSQNFGSIARTKNIFAKSKVGLSSVAGFGLGAVSHALWGPAAHLAPVLGGALTGWNTQRATLAFGQDYVLPTINQIFKDACQFLKAPHIYRASATRLIKELAQI